MPTVAYSQGLHSMVSGVEQKRSEALSTLSDSLKNQKLTETELKQNTERMTNALVGWWEHLLSNPDEYDGNQKQTLSELLIECLFVISQKPTLLSTLSLQSLEQLIKSMLKSLVSPSVRRLFTNRKSLIARLNDITLAVLQNCDRTMAFYILISFLKSAQPHDCEKPIESSSAFSNVVVKCLAKLMILIPKVIREMKIDMILRVIHEFFTLKP
eukprot:UN23761